MFKIIGLVVALLLLILAVMLATTPWRVHGGRFATEYLIVAVPVALIGFVILGISLYWG